MNQSLFFRAAALIGMAGLFWLAFSHVPESTVMARPSAGRAGFRVGEHAPDFDLRSLDGGCLKLSELRGRPVLLNFWATWCAPCRVEMPWLIELDKQYRTGGLEIIGVSLDDSVATDEVAAFVNKRGVNYHVLLGNSAIADAYGGVRLMPQNVFIDPDGKIIKATTGLTGKKDLEDGVKALLSSRKPSRLVLGGQP